MAAQYHNMVGKPLFDILSKLPSKSLLRFRCVSKLWREYIDDSYFVSVHDKQVTEDPTPIIFYLARNSELAKTLCFHMIESDNITNHVLKAKSNPVFEFVDKKLLSPTYINVGSCNGLVIIETDGKLMPTFTVIHPINKQSYVLPKLPLRGNQVSCGLGFDSVTNTFKMVCVYHKNGRVGRPRSAHCTMVHVFGTNSWHKIPQVPAYSIFGKAVFAHGCLHWLATYHSEDGARQVIWFDVKNEEFGLIRPPKRNNIYHLNGHLVNLDGQVGYFGDATTVWLLNDKKEWTLHCDFKDHEFPDDSFIEVLGCLNKDGDILIKVTNWRTEQECIYIYNLKNRVMHAACIVGLDLEDRCNTEIVMFPNSLLDIITNSNLFKTRA
ncbi:F-box domain containing protein [Tanacetum coccineum]